MAEGTALLGTGRDPAAHTVEFLADAAVGPAELHCVAVGALRMQHFLVSADEKLELVSLPALVVQLELLLVQLLRRHEVALLVMHLKGPD